MKSINGCGLKLRLKSVLKDSLGIETDPQNYFS